MNFMKKTVVYLLLLVFDVKTVVNDAEKLESCVTKIANTLVDSNESETNLLKLIDQSTVILKAFCSENLINFVEENDDDVDDDEQQSKKKSTNSENYVGSSEDDDYYDDYYFYKGNTNDRLKILMTFTPITIYKGTSFLRQLESFNNQEYFLIKGQLNATLELSKQEKILYQKKCFNNPKINVQQQTLNENHLVEQRIRRFVPGQLIIFGKLDKNNAQSENRLVVKTNGIIRWKATVENFVWNNLGWSSWGKWSPCSKSCKVGIQQRHRHCLTNQQNRTGVEFTSKVYKTDKFESATTKQHLNQQLCNGYNIEQRDCNLFECKDAVNLLSLVNNTKTSFEELSAHINQLVGGNDFTIMLTMRSKVNKKAFPFEESSQHSVSLRSDNKQSSLTISIIENGIKVVQEKDSKSEMFAIKLNLFDLHWHQIAFSFRNDGLITCYIDCNWDSSFVMTKNSFEVPPHTKVEMNSKLNDVIEWKQLSLISGNHERSQCSNERTPIYDNNKLLERMFNDETN